MNAMNTYKIFVLTLLFFLPGRLYAGDNPSVLVQTAKVIEQTVSEQLRVYGTLLPDPDQSISLSFSHGGYITKVRSRLGQRVKKGDILLELDTSPTAHMQFIQARSNVDFARQELAHQLRLEQEQLATRSQVDAAKKALLDAKSSLTALRKQGFEQSHEKLISPMDGIITQLNVTQGQRVQAETTAMLIASEDKLIVRLGVEPEDLKFISPGLPIVLTSVFEPDYQAKTVVREVHAMINHDTHLVDVLTVIPDEQIDHLVLGSKMTARIQLDAHKAIVVPRSAVLQDETGDFIFLVSAGKAHKVKVVRGVNNRKWIEVKGEVEAGDVVVVVGNYELNDGMSVREAN